MHPALGVSHSLPSDVFTNLFDWFFESPVFERWCRRKGKWQLHCVGGPGAGKTTLSALALKYLKQKCQDDNIPIASIFILQDVLDYENTFIEDFLGTIYSQLGESEALVDDDSDDLYKEYEKACEEDARVSARINLIQEALYSRLSSCPRAYLILDGPDRCSSALHLMLETHLAALQNRGLSIMITSRLPVFDNGEAWCDHKYHNREHNEGNKGDVDDEDDDYDDYEVRESLILYLQCKTCEDVMCFPCKEKGEICGNCGDNSALHEPYDYVTFRIGQIPSHEMEKFVAWDLEREHGELGLASSITRKPPLSNLGQSLLEDRTANTAHSLVQRIVDLANGNIGLAKARLDLIHEAESLEGVEARRDRLPANIVAMFDAGLKQIEAQRRVQKDLGLNAISVAGSAFYGIPIPDLQIWLQQSRTAFGRVSTRSGEDILEAARGFLLATRDNPANIRLYHTSFYYYVAQNYNESLYQANCKLQADDKDDEKPMKSGRTVRFEPISITEEPKEVTPFKLSRTTTGKVPDKQMSHPRLLFRKGTRPW
ncbi:hypothetical protein K469DRAFT_570948 [Zopfia rhizophila CBS 207.26]|uniref:Nephrocystin 3-like N-terminal domain-containing protein n=1 Tax=Zopfia rhizophila CBS 207.26 TaxID=1314779 RepID=A0A6A6EAJ9_9PEZI|nr:hypothetical protein K469DRAFT_570948 [Zopfia rhizophila CBS 207.26]